MGFVAENIWQSNGYSNSGRVGVCGYRACLHAVVGYEGWKVVCEAQREDQVPMRSTDFFREERERED